MFYIMLCRMWNALCHISSHVMLYAMSCHFICHVMSYMSSHVMWSQVMPYHMSCYMSYNIIYHVISHVICHVMSCIVSYYVLDFCLGAVITHWITFRYSSSCNLCHIRIGPINVHHPPLHCIDCLHLRAGQDRFIPNTCFLGKWCKRCLTIPMIFIFKFDIYFYFILVIVM